MLHLRITDIIDMNICISSIPLHIGPIPLSMPSS